MSATQEALERLLHRRERIAAIKAAADCPACRAFAGAPCRAADDDYGPMAAAPVIPFAPYLIHTARRNAYRSQLTALWRAQRIEQATL